MTTLFAFFGRIGFSEKWRETFGKRMRSLAKLSWLLLALPVSGNAQVTADWTQGPGGVTVAGDGLGNVYTARYDMNPAGDILIIKHNSNGVEQWQTSYDQTDPTKWEQAVWVALRSCGQSRRLWHAEVRLFQPGDRGQHPDEILPRRQPAVAGGL